MVLTKCMIHFISVCWCHSLECILLDVTTRHNTQHHTISNICKLYYSTSFSQNTHTHIYMIHLRCLPFSSQCRTFLASSQLVSCQSTVCCLVVSVIGHCHGMEVGPLESLPKHSSWAMSSSSLQTCLEISTSNTVLLEIQLLESCVDGWLLTTSLVHP